MKELRPLPLVYGYSEDPPRKTSEAQTSVISGQSLPPTELTPLVREKKTVSLPLPGQEPNTAPQSPSSAAAWPFPTPARNNGLVVPQNSSMKVPELIPISRPGDQPPKLQVLNRDASGNSAVEVEKAPKTVPVEVKVEPAPIPELQVIRKGPDVTPLVEVPAITPVIRNNDTYVVLGVSGDGTEVDFRGVFSKTYIEDIKLDSRIEKETSPARVFQSKCNALLKSMYETQGGSQYWVARRNSGHCTVVEASVTSPAGDVRTELRVIDNDVGNGAVWAEEVEAQPYISYKFVMFKVKLNENNVCLAMESF